MSNKPRRRLVVYQYRHADLLGHEDEVLTSSTTSRSSSSSSASAVNVTDIRQRAAVI